MKRIASFLIALAMIFNSAFAGITVNAEELEGSSGYKVISVEMIDNMAYVELEVQNDCIVIVAIYDEAGNQMLAYGSGGVMAAASKVGVDINTDNMPEQYYVRAYLVDTYSKQPLSVEYESIIYAEEADDVAINETNFPDENFRTYVTQNCDTDGDGLLSKAEIENVTEITCDFSNIYSLDGIGFFGNLEVLTCEGNELSNLDVSANTALESLNCGSNNLTSLDVSNNTALKSLSCNYNDLSNLDVSNNVELTDLACGVSGLTSLDVSNNTALESLSCFGNDLPNLDVSNNVALIELNCANINLTNLDVSKNTALESLSCGYNSNLSNLDVSNNVALTNLDCGNCGLTSLDVSKNTALEMLKCYGGNLTNLDVSANTALTYLYCSDNALTSLDVSANTELSELSCFGNNLTNLDVSANTELIILYCRENKLTSLDVSNNTKLRSLECEYNNLTSLDVSNSELWNLVCNDNNLTSLYINSYTAQYISPGDYANNPLTEPTIVDAGGTEDADDVAINETNFPDENFRTYVAENCDTDGDGLLSKAEIENVTEINCDFGNVYSLDGIEFFGNLKVLSCFASGVTNLDVSKNTKLTKLVCPYNGLTSLDVSANTALESLECMGNYLTSLDVSANTALKSLDCNSNNLTDLDVSANTALESLNCDANNLTDLDVSANTALESLYYDDNDLPDVDVSNNLALINLSCASNGLTNLDVSKNTALKSLVCSDNVLTSLDVSANTALESLICLGNNLTNLDVSNNTALESLNCQANNLASLDVSNNIALTRLYCEFNSLNDLDVSNNTALTDLDCSGNGLTSLDVSNNAELTGLSCYNNSLTSLDVSNNAELISLNCSDNSLTSLYINSYTAQYISPENYANNPLTEPTIVDAGGTGGTGGTEDTDAVAINETNFPDENFRAYVAQNCDTDGNGVLSKAEIENVTGIDCSSSNIYSLDGIEFFDNLEVLSCLENGLTSLDVSNNTALTFLNCYNNGLTSLDVSNNTALTVLVCDDNSLTSLDVSNNTELTFFACSINGLTDLDVNNNAELTSLSCNGDSLTSLDVSNNANLTYLDCSYNGLTSLDVSKNLALTDLSCSFNGLTDLDVNNNAELTSLFCNDNSLTSLDVSNNANLTYLYCSYNGLTSLDVSKNLALTDLSCSNNGLTSLDVSNNTELTYFCCSDNGLTSLDVSKNTELTDLRCGANNLISLDVNNNTELTSLDCYNSSLTNLDVSANTVLEFLNCGVNILTDLDVRANTALIALSCDGNNLTSLDVSNNPALISLYCSYNGLTSLDVSKNTVLEELWCYNNNLTSLYINSYIAQFISPDNYANNQLTEPTIVDVTVLAAPPLIAEPLYYNLFGAVEADTADVELASVEAITTEYSNLQPNEVYNFYVVKTDMTDALVLFENDNLLYVRQYTSDASGNLSITYKPSEIYDGAVELLCEKAWDDENPDITGDKKLSECADSAIEITGSSYNTSVDESFWVKRMMPSINESGEEELVEVLDYGKLYKIDVPANAVVNIEAGTMNMVGFVVYEELDNPDSIVMDAHVMGTFRNESDEAKSYYMWVYNSDDIIEITKATTITEEPDKICIYSWNSELKTKLEYFYEKYPEYADKINYVQISGSAGSDNYIDTVMQNACNENNNTSIIAMDSSVAQDMLASGIFAPVKDIGITDELYENAYDYTKSFGTYNGELTALAWGACPGNFIYNTVIAEEVLGFSDPASVQQCINTPAKFIETAKKMQEAGYYMSSGCEALSSNGSIASSVDSNTSNKCSALCEELRANGYDTGATAFSDSWLGDMHSGNVFGFFGTTWLTYWAFEYDAAYPMAVCEGPINYAWGGTYLGVVNHDKNNELAKLVLETLCCDTDVMYSMCGSGSDAFVNNQAAIERLIADGYGSYSDLKDAQNPLPVWNNVAQNIGSFTWEQTHANDIYAIEVDASKEFDLNNLTDKGFVLECFKEVTDNADYNSETGVITVKDLSKVVKYIYTVDGVDITLQFAAYQKDDSGFAEAPVIKVEEETIPDIVNNGETTVFWEITSDGEITGKVAETVVETGSEDTSIIITEHKDITGTEVKNADIEVAQKAISTEVLDKSIEVAQNKAEEYKNNGNEAATAKVIHATFTDDASESVISSDIIDKLKAAEVSLEIGKVNDNEDVEYSWRFDADEIKNSAAENIIDVNTKIVVFGTDVENGLDEYENNAAINDLTASGADNCVVSFAHSGTLPGNTEVRVNVGTQYENSSDLYYYYFNMIANKLEYCGAAMVADGYVTINISHCSDYVITDKKVTVAVESVELSDSTLDMNVGESKNLTVTVTPEDATNKAVSWESSNNDVAKVTSDGKVTAVGAGTATITCKSTDGSNKSASCSVTVTKPVVNVTSIALSSKALNMEVGDSKNLTVKVTPENATNKAVSWESSNKSVVKVTSDGKVTAIGAGTATITCKSTDGSNKSASCKVTVTKTETPEPEKTVPKVDVSYRTHVQSFGWQPYVANGAMSGTSGQAKRLEGINISVASAEKGKSVDLGIQYTTHCQSYGWLPWSADGDMSGTEGEAKRLEAIMIQLTGADASNYDVYYRVHAQSYGWLGWAKNGAPAGTAGYAKRLEGIQIVVVKKGESIDKNMQNIISVRNEAYIAQSGSSPVVGGATTSATDPVISGADTPNVTYRTHVQTYGWQGWKYNGQMSGTEGQSKRLEGINIKLTNKPYDGGISYTTHVQTYGWQGDIDNPATWKKDGEMSGTSGEAKRLEAICITLTGDMAKHYDIYYRVHAQSFGWLDWAKNGAPAGTAGYAKRLEGIEIVLVPKGGNAPGETARPYVSK